MLYYTQIIMKTHFSPSFFAGNRARLRELFTGTAPIVITANGLLQRNADSNFPFRQDSSFWYLTGINLPDAVLVIDKGKEYLIMPSRSDNRAVFDGALNYDEIRDLSGINQIVDARNGWKQLESRVKRVQHVATLAPPKIYSQEQGLYANPARRRLTKKLQTINTEIELLDLRTHLMKMRGIKQEVELDAIREAIAITATAFRKIRNKGLQKYSYEQEIEAAITAVFCSNGASHAYEPIVAAGGNACTLHYTQNRSQIKPGDVVLLDVGAELENYAADITRTYSVSEPTKRQRQIWQAVVEVQDFAINQLKPGAFLAECEKAVEQFMGEKLRELGLIKTIDSDSVRQFYPHATSHYLGLDVHDVGDYRAPLEPNMVVTCEPGIYIPAEGIGIRIEDDILIAADSKPEILSRKLSKEL